MKFIYPAIIRRKASGGYLAIFPDLEDCRAEGDTPDETVERANEAAGEWLGLELMDDDGQLPPVTDVRDMELKEGDIVRNICVNIRFMEGWDE